MEAKGQAYQRFDVEHLEKEIEDDEAMEINDATELAQDNSENEVFDYLQEVKTIKNYLRDQ